MAKKVEVEVNKNTPAGKGLRTLYQAVAGVVVSFLAGLWNVPGVPEYVTRFAKADGVEFLLFLAVSVGVPAGLIAFVQNRLGK